MQSQEMPRGKEVFAREEMDRDMFLRVWDRVMPQDSEACPVTVERTNRRELPDRDTCGGDFPSRDDVPCLGGAAMGEQGQLRELISRELDCWRTYKMLAQRSCQGARVLSAMAGNCRKRAKRLSAALFLMSNVQFWPVERQCVPTPRSWLGTLREQFVGEQSRECVYRAAAEDCRDRCLRQLYLDLALECAEHAAAIRTLIETV